MDNLQFELLGPLRLVAGGQEHLPRGPKVTKILALLALRAGRMVHLDALVDELWGDRPPRQATGTVRTHVYHLRQLLGTQLGVPGEELVRTEPPGYVLAADRESVDAVRFGKLAGESRDLLSAGRHSDAVATAKSGLRLWRGPALANVSAGPLLAGHVRQLEESRLELLSVRIEAEMELGLHRQLVGELRDLVIAHPFNEWFHACLIEVLRRTGRRADALGAFHALRTTLGDELGLEPSAGLRALQRQVLLGDDSPTPLHLTIAS
jgi:DNA-binding SARP family transcriptional activator